MKPLDNPKDEDSDDTLNVKRFNKYQNKYYDDWLVYTVIYFLSNIETVSTC